MEHIKCHPLIPTLAAEHLKIERFRYSGLADRTTKCAPKGDKKCPIGSLLSQSSKIGQSGRITHHSLDLPQTGGRRHSQLAPVTLKRDQRGFSIYSGMSTSTPRRSAETYALYNTAIVSRANSPLLRGERLAAMLAMKS